MNVPLAEEREFFVPHIHAEYTSFLARHLTQESKEERPLLAVWEHASGACRSLGIAFLTLVFASHLFIPSLVPSQCGAGGEQDRESLYQHGAEGALGAGSGCLTRETSRREWLVEKREQLVCKLYSPG